MRKLVAFGALFALVGSLAVAAVSADAPSFARAKSYPTGRLPDSVALGDLNGDGKLDLVTANTLAETVSVRMNKGDGSFQAKADYRAGNSPQAVAIGDLNRDGRQDLAVAHSFPNRLPSTPTVGTARSIAVSSTKSQAVSRRLRSAT